MLESELVSAITIAGQRSDVAFSVPRCTSARYASRALVPPGSRVAVR